MSMHDLQGNLKINWFPGHMAKAMRKVKEKLKMVDLVLEVRDARVPMTSANSALHEILEQKLRLIVINKANLADQKETNKWQNKFKSEGLDFVFVNSLDKASVKKITKLAKELMIKHERKRRGPFIRMMVVGLPNTGKSTIINRLAGKSAARSGDKPGLTQRQQWILVDNEIELLDTPGIMPPKIETTEQGMWLCSIHAISDDIVGEEMVSIYIIEELLRRKSKALIERYKLKDFEMTALEALDHICLVRNFKAKGGFPDYDRAYKVVLSDFRKGELGLVTFEKFKDKE